ncbi:MAG: hypothetical protein ACYTHK_12560 [Planctomycetota bacterium]
MRFLVLCLLAACASTNGPGPEVVYPIDRKTAEKIAYDALALELPRNRIERIEHRDPGFRCTFYFGRRPYIVEVYIFDAKGQKPDGTVVDGIRYDIDYAGFVPEGDDKVFRVAQWIRQEARKTVEPLPAAN